MDALLKAILDDAPAHVRQLLKTNPTLATRQTTQARLYQTSIIHWLYTGDTALHLAAAGHRVEIVQLLLAASADPNAAANHRRSTPLHYAADGRPTSPRWNENDQVQTLQHLLDAGAHINAPDKNGATPLHRAVRTRSAAAVQYLLQRGADPLLRNHPGSTPFHLAVQNTGHGGTGADAAITAQRQIIETFLTHGLRPTLKDANGKTVLAWARSPWIRDLLT